MQANPFFTDGIVFSQCRAEIPAGIKTEDQCEDRFHEDESVGKHGTSPERESQFDLGDHQQDERDHKHDQREKASEAFCQQFAFSQRKQDICDFQNIKKDAVSAFPGDRKKLIVVEKRNQSIPLLFSGSSQRA